MNEIRAQLSVLKIEGKWIAVVRDKRVTQEVAARHSVGPDAGSYQKRLFPVSTCGKVNPHTHWMHTTNEIRTYWIKHTSPWEDGRRMLSVGYLDEFANTTRRLKDESFAAFDKFELWYPQGVELAESGLNGLFNREDYPSISDLSKKFDISVEYAPLPQAHHFISDVLSPAMDAIRADLTARNQVRLEDARESIWLEVLDPVQKLANTMLTPGTPKFHNTLVTNVRDIANRIPALDFDHSPRLEEARQVLIGLSNVDPETLRRDPVLRKAIGNEAAAIFSGFGSYVRKLKMENQSV